MRILLLALLTTGCTVNFSSTTLDDHTRRLGVIERNLDEMAEWSRAVEAAIAKLNQEKETPE